MVLRKALPCNVINNKFKELIWENSQHSCSLSLVSGNFSWLFLPKDKIKEIKYTHIGIAKTFVYNSLCLNLSGKYHNIHNTYGIYAKIIEKEAMNLKDSSPPQVCVRKNVILLWQRDTDEVSHTIWTMIKLDKNWNTKPEISWVF